jgi:membrane protein DedA with SNARE-associated domain
MLDSVTNYIITLSPGWFYFVLFLSAYVENVAPPVPGDTVTVFAAYIVGRSHERFAGVFLSTTAGSIAGFMTIYALGRCLRPEYFIRRDFRFLPAAYFEKAGEWFERYGLWVVLVNRFLSGIRSVISMVCGLYRLPWLRVLTISGVGCAVWNGLLIWAGYELGANWRLVETVFSEYNKILLLLAVLLAAAWLVRKKLFSSST